jgi:hypothetical protein
MHGPINVKSPNNTSKWQVGFNSSFKVLILILLSHSYSVLGQAEPVRHMGDVKNVYRILGSVLKVRDQLGDSPLCGAVILRFILNGV